ncbi:MAG: hypothetical protein EOM37_11295 [Proteobacteria bacterium]|nr:hypothetical protein [Pseudomonadota bacterium]
MSTAPLPEIVEIALDNWDGLFFFAYNGFETSGPGAVGITDDMGWPELVYGPRTYFVENGMHEVTNLLDIYDPEMEIVLYFDVLEGNRTVRVRTPPKGRSPKRVWFFEMLRRATDEPEALPKHLPAWFLSALEDLDKAKNTNSSLD